MLKPNGDDKTLKVYRMLSMIIISIQFVIGSPNFMIFGANEDAIERINKINAY